MTVYNVHLYREMRLRFDDIEAGSHEEAAAIAGAKPDHEAVSIDDCGGANIAALVDVVGDDECEQSRTIDLPHVENTAPKVLAALDMAITAMNNTPAFNSGIQDPDNPKRNLSSYRLIPKLEAVVREARGPA